MMTTRRDFEAHIAEYFRDGGAADNPEYGGTIVDWVWDWLVARGTTGPATGPDVRWVTLRTSEKL